MVQTQHDFELEVEGPLNCSYKENELLEEFKELFATFVQARAKTIEVLPEVARRVDEITNDQKKRNVTGGFMSVFGKYHQNIHEQAH